MPLPLEMRCRQSQYLWMEAKLEGEGRMYVLRYSPGNASLTPHMLLRKFGAPFLAAIGRSRE